MLRESYVSVESPEERTENCFSFLSYKGAGLKAHWSINSHKTQTLWEKNSLFMLLLYIMLRIAKNGGDFHGAWYISPSLSLLTVSIINQIHFDVKWRTLKRRGLSEFTTVFAIKFLEHFVRGRRSLEVWVLCGKVRCLQVGALTTKAKRKFIFWIQKFEKKLGNFVKEILIPWDHRLESLKLSKKIKKSFTNIKMLDFYQNLNINSGMLQDQCLEKNSLTGCGQAGKNQNGKNQISKIVNVNHHHNLPKSFHSVSRLILYHECWTMCFEIQVHDSY